MGAGSIYAGGGLIARYPQAVRVGIVVNGVMLLACAYGIYRRYLFAWWAGFAVLLLRQAYSVVDLFIRGGPGNPSMPAVPFAVASLIVATIWGAAGACRGFTSGGGKVERSCLSLRHRE
ncbi:hypothetical protein [Rhodanobacter sp. BL-MT-08]